MSTATETFTYWSLLGISPESNPDEIKKAFRREAMQWHPDLNRNNRNAEERFKWIKEAYEVLNDPRRRFEWEIEGCPTFEIKDLPIQTSTDCAAETKKKSPNGDSGFNSAEKFLLLLISTFSLLFLNAFIL